MDAFNTAIQINNDIESIRRDLEAGHYTYPLTAAALATGHAPGTHPPRSALISSLILSPAVAEAHDRARGYYETVRRMSDELGIDDLSGFIEWHMEDLKKSEEYWRGLCVEGDKVPASFLRFLDAAAIQDHPLPDLSRSLGMAWAFLQADPESRESWEVQRTGVWGQELLVGDVFSRALIAEVLARRDRAAPGQVEAILEQYRENGWRYYRDFKALPPDIDDIAQSIRLLKYAAWDEETKRDYLETPLRWLAANRAPDGGFPVWLTNEIEDIPEGGWVALGGEHCLACEANLIDALADLEEKEENSWTVEGTANLLERWEEQRSNGIYYYRPAYGISMVARCLARQSENVKMERGIIGRIQVELERLGEEYRAAPAQGVLSLAAGLHLAATAPDPPCDALTQRLSVLTGNQSCATTSSPFASPTSPATP